jgi:hypothetical protein
MYRSSRGRHERAQTLISQLADQGERWPMPSIRALTNEAAAVLAKSSGAPEEALRRLHLAHSLEARLQGEAVVKPSPEADFTLPAGISRRRWL